MGTGNRPLGFQQALNERLFRFCVLGFAKQLEKLTNGLNGFHGAVFLNRLVT